ncbi:hypothetical protein L9F63_001088 [Diploptera punctata]|uniref:Uncharacterized protein n=1 Tax=Diploptera punctata TaxID=6984 RepID=A0AAD8AN72_DIPPU|nr:hypothetical protein L9F63_001088 [Diploptera punctata]
MSDSEDESWSGDSPVTSEWLEAILASYHQQELHHCSSEDDGEELSVNIGEFSVGPGCDAGECVLSDILAVRVQYRIAPGTPDPRTLNLIVKLLLKILSAGISSPKPSSISVRSSSILR